VADPLTAKAAAAGQVRPPERAAAMSGRSGAPFRMVVEEGKIHEFAQAAKSGCAEHLRDGDPIAPVTFLAAAQLWMRPENSAWFGVTRDPARRLHGEQEFVFHGALPRAGMELTAQHRIGEVFAKQGRRGGVMTFTRMSTTFWTDSPERPVAEALSLSIETSQAPGDEASVPDRDAASRSDAGPVPAAAPELDPVTGPGPEPFTDAPLTVTDFVRYQGASGDFNPIHHDTSVARAAGFPGPFAVGMLPAAVAACRLSAHFGAEAVRHYRVRWHSQAWPGEALTYRSVPCEGDFDVQMKVTRPDGSVHLQAWAKLDPALR
jgi:acyl dehydratase